MSFRDYEKSLSDVRKTMGIEECYEKNRQLESEVGYRSTRGLRSCTIGRDTL
jgi:hypothetical protein